MSRCRPSFNNESITTAVATISSPLNDPNGLNITLQGTKATAITGAISACQPDLSILNDAAAVVTVSGAITGPNGINITHSGQYIDHRKHHPRPMTTNNAITVNLQSALSSRALWALPLRFQGTLIAPMGLNATINSGFLHLNSNSNLINFSTFTVNNGGSLSGGSNAAQWGEGTTFLLNNGSTFRVNNTRTLR